MGVLFADNKDPRGMLVQNAKREVQPEAALELYACLQMHMMLQSVLAGS